jgi:hypothetical protein
VARLRRGLALTVAFAFAFAFAPAFPLQAQGAPPPSATSGTSDCDLNSARGEIKQVIYIQLDNVHFRRDNPNVSSALEQIPNLLAFITDGGVLMTNLHTPLKSHTADDIITSLTGVYGARHGQPISNSFGWFTLPGSKFIDGFASRFSTGQTS